MRLRKNAVDMPDDEIGTFLEAIMRLKAKQAPDQTDISVYDQFAALHGAVMGVTTPKSGTETINFAHGNIGFLPWHRQYLLKFEDALRSEVAGVTIPYWDWADEIGSANKLFTGDFLSSRHWGGPRPISDGVLQFTVPPPVRPQWWPSGLAGFRVNLHLEERLGVELARGSMESNWPPLRLSLRQLTKLNHSLNNRHPLWTFWQIVEQGSNQLPQTHNAGHRFIGGHMGGSFSPNDPIFWLHHANVDRLWDAWQKEQIKTGTSINYIDTWPNDQELSPFDNRPPPEGHNIADSMWPWVGSNAGYSSATVSKEIQNRLPSISHKVTVSKVLDLNALDISYQ